MQHCRVVHLPSFIRKFGSQTSFSPTFFLGRRTFDGEYDATEWDSLGGAPAAASDASDNDSAASCIVSLFCVDADAIALHGRVFQHQKDGVRQTGTS